MFRDIHSYSVLLHPPWSLFFNFFLIISFFASFLSSSPSTRSLKFRSKRQPMQRANKPTSQQAFQGKRSSNSSVPLKELPRTPATPATPYLCFLILCASPPRHLSIFGFAVASYDVRLSRAGGTNDKPGLLDILSNDRNFVGKEISTGFSYFFHPSFSSLFFFACYFWPRLVAATLNSRQRSPWTVKWHIITR